MPDSETTATAITDEHKQAVIKVVSQPVMTWIQRCINNAWMQTGYAVKTLYIHPDTALSIQWSLFAIEDVPFDISQLRLEGAPVETTTAIPKYCASALLADGRTALMDYNGDVLVCL